MALALLCVISFWDAFVSLSLTGRVPAVVVLRSCDGMRNCPNLSVDAWS